MRDLPRHPRSDAWIRSLGGRRRLYPDFGPSEDSGKSYGIPYNVEDDTQPKVQIDFYYPDESAG